MAFVRYVSACLALCLGLNWPILLLRASAQNFDLIWLSQGTKARVCTQAFLNLGEPFGVDIENYIHSLIPAATAGSEVCAGVFSILSPDL